MIFFSFSQRFSDIFAICWTITRILIGLVFLSTKADPVIYFVNNRYQFFTALDELGHSRQIIAFERMLKKLCGGQEFVDRLALP